jgi:hypothetical protein
MAAGSEASCSLSKRHGSGRSQRPQARLAAVRFSVKGDDGVAVRANDSGCGGLARGPSRSCTTPVGEASPQPLERAEAKAA